MADWPVPKFGYGSHVTVKPLENVDARVVDLHFIGMTSSVEYDVVYYHDGEQKKIRVFEDELSSNDGMGR